MICRCAGTRSRERRLSVGFFPRQPLLRLSPLGLPMNLLDPQGPVAVATSTILVDSIFIMLVIVVPTIIAILACAWWFRASNPRSRFQPDFVYSGRVEMVVWSIPALRGWCSPNQSCSS